MKNSIRQLVLLAFFVLSGCQIVPTTETPVQPKPTPTTEVVLPSPPPTTISVIATLTPSATPTTTATRTPTATRTSTQPPTATFTPTPDTPDAEVLEIGEGLRVRVEPGLTASVLENLSAGTQLNIIGRTSDGGWYQIITPQGGTGWVWGNYLRLLVDAGTIPITGEALQAPTVPAANNSGVVSGVSSNARMIFERGQQLGNRRDVFSKVGDSLTVATFVLYPIGWGAYNLGSYQQFQSAINFFSSTTAREGNSFANISLSADNGWTTRDILDPAHARAGVCQAGETPLECEYAWCAHPSR